VLTAKQPAPPKRKARRVALTKFPRRDQKLGSNETHRRRNRDSNAWSRWEPAPSPSRFGISISIAG
jgi:hypothetical protein